MCFQCVYGVDVLNPTQQEIDNIVNAHWKKIDISDVIYVVNVGGYIGNSTKNEIEYAKKHGKEIIYHERTIFKGENMENKKIVEIVYTNWKGVTAIRHIIPKDIFFGSTEWHQEEQWLLNAFDVEKQADRLFALKDIQIWKQL